MIALIAAVASLILGALGHAVWCAYRRRKARRQLLREMDEHARPYWPKSER